MDEKTMLKQNIQIVKDSMKNNSKFAKELSQL